MTLTGTEILYVTGTSPTGGPAATEFITTTGQIAALAASTGVGETVNTAITTVGAGTLTAAGIIGGVITRSGPTAAFTDTTATAAQVVAAIGSPFVGQSFLINIINTTAYTQTITNGSGVTLSGSAVILGNSVGTFLVTLTSLSAVTILRVSSEVYSQEGTATFSTVSGIGTTQTYRTSSALTKNASAAYSDITGLTAIPLVAGATYKFRAVLPSTVASGTGGIKYGFNYTTATLTSIESTAMGFTASAVAVQHTTTTTTQTDLFTQAAVVIMAVIEGTMVVNAAGTMAVQMAQNTSNGSDTVALVGGTFELQRIA